MNVQAVAAIIKEHGTPFQDGFELFVSHHSLVSTPPGWVIQEFQDFNRRGVVLRLYPRQMIVDVKPLPDGVPSPPVPAPPQ